VHACAHVQVCVGVRNFTEPFQVLNQAYGEDCVKGSPGSKKARMSWLKIKVMLVVFFDWKGIVRHEFLPHGQVVNKQLYQEVLVCLRDTVHRKRPELWKDQTWMFHHNDALAHMSLLIRSYLAKHQTSIVPNLPYSPDLAPAGFFLYPKLKTTLKDVVSKP
jgi:hypothetical protein